VPVSREIFIMLLLSRFIVAACVAFGALGLANPGHAQNPPAVVFESMLDSYFDNTSGYVSFVNYDIAFAPKGPAKGQVGIVDSKGKILAQHRFSETYKIRNEVFGRVLVTGTPGIKLTEPGRYLMVFAMNGKLISRFPFTLIQTGAGADPFNPTKTYAFDGPWRKVAHITQDTFKGQPIPVFTVWLGGLDMAKPNTHQAYFQARLLSGGKVVAHSKSQTSFYSGGHFKRRKFLLFQPHDVKKAANAIPFTMKDLLKDGTYELNLTRRSDGAKLRSFNITVDKGKFRILKRTTLGYKPAHDFIVPRVTKKGSTAYEYEKAIWIAGK
jgi:hypothetical protein